MTDTTWKTMQLRDDRDTEAIQDVIRAFWQIENVARQYPQLLRPESDPFQDTLVELVEVLRAEAIAKRRKPINRVYRREPLPADKQGRVHGVALTDSLAAKTRHGSTGRVIPAGISSVENDPRFSTAPGPVRVIPVNR